MASATPKKNGVPDFNPDDMLDSLTGHTEDISRLNQRVEAIEEYIKSPVKFADLLAGCITKAADAQESLARHFIKMLQGNAEVQEVFKKEVIKVNRDANVNFWTKAGGIVVTASISVAVTVVGGVILYCLLKK